MLWNVALISASSAGTWEPAKAGSKNTRRGAVPSASSHQTLALWASPWATTAAPVSEPRAQGVAGSPRTDSAQRAAIGDAVDAPAAMADIAPMSGQPRELEGLIQIEPRRRGRRADPAPVRIDQPGMEQPVDRLGRDLVRVGAMQRRQIALADDAVEVFAAPGSAARHRRFVQFRRAAEIGESPVMAAAVEQDLPPHFARREGRHVDGIAGLAQGLRRDSIPPTVSPSPSSWWNLKKNSRPSPIVTMPLSEFRLY